MDIRPLTSDDVEGASVLSATAGWNQRLEDWRMLIHIAPRGSFCAVDGGRIVGTAIGIDYGSFGWIAMMLVDPAYRGRGVGAALLESAIAGLSPHNPIRLDATPLGRPLYERFGFVEESTLSRRVASPDARCIGHPPHGALVRRLTSADLPLLASRDRAVFGADRAVLLGWLLREAPHYAYVTTQNDGPAYCFGRPGRLFDQIGPVVAATDDEAIALVTAATGAAGDRPVMVDAFDANNTFCGWLGTCGFAIQRPLFRMCRRPTNGDRHVKLERGEYAILGPEFA